MAIYLGDTAIKKVYLGATEIKKIYQGTTLLYSSFTYDPDLLTYIDSLVTPLSEGQLALLNTFIVNLKSGLSIANLSDAFDVMYILAGETAESSLRNMVRRAHDATAVNAPLFTALEGFTGNGINAYINCNYNLLNDSIRYTVYDASLGVYTRTFATIDIMIAGALAGTWMRISSSRTWLHINSNDDAPRVYVLAGGAGMRIGSLIGTDGTGLFLYMNKNKYGATTAGDINGILNEGVTLLKYSTYYSPSQISFAFTGRGFTQSEANIITDVFEAYMDANGKGVIA